MINSIPTWLEVTQCDVFLTGATDTTPPTEYSAYYTMDFGSTITCNTMTLDHFRKARIPAELWLWCIRLPHTIFSTWQNKQSHPDAHQTLCQWLWIRMNPERFKILALPNRSCEKRSCLIEGTIPIKKLIIDWPAVLFSIKVVLRSSFADGAIVGFGVGLWFGPINEGLLIRCLNGVRPGLAEGHCSGVEGEISGWICSFYMVWSTGWLAKGLINLKWLN